jgi:glycosyltransferase involved in cell wall biosynthesis
VEKKGCIHLIRAMAHVQKEIPEARLVIVGEGPLSILLQQEAARHLNSCLFLGQRSHEEVPEWMQRARLLVAPSIRAKNGDTEGLPSVLCEAQAMGLPPVTFETDGVIEALPEERRVSMPREQDEAALAEEIKRLLHDDERWQHASTLGRRYMEAGFDLVRQTRLLEDIYDGVIARRHD